MSNKRIDLNQFEATLITRQRAQKLLCLASAELKRCYDEIDKLNRALSATNSVHFTKKWVDLDE
jgi:hypothetical protein